jgi:hypothetical protein
VTYGFNIRIEQVLPIETFADIIGVAGPGGPKPVELPGPATIRFVTVPFVTNPTTATAIRLV